MARYVRVKGDNRAAQLHLAYLVRDGIERDGTRGNLYGPGQGFSRDSFEQTIAGEQRQFRFIVSPEDGDRLDLTAFTRRFMSQVEKDLGRGSVWAAVNHHNTDNPHVHIVIRGIDVEGKDLRIDGRYIGPAGELACVARDGFTVLDLMLAGHLSADNRPAPTRLAGAPRAERASCLARLATLEQMGIARPEVGGVWQLKSGWDEDLKQLEVVSEARARLARQLWYWPSRSSGDNGGCFFMPIKVRGARHFRSHGPARACPHPALNLDEPWFLAATRR